MQPFDRPIVLSVAGNTIKHGLRVLAIVWDANSTSGDRVALNDPASGEPIWSASTDSTQTYLGGNFGPSGIHCPDGLRLTQISSGNLYVYPRVD
jgi:hypothetical protein